MGLFNKTKLDEMLKKQQTILESSIYLANLDSTMRNILNQIKEPINSSKKLELLEEFKKREQNAENLTEKVLELRKETRKATIKEISSIQEILKKTREKLKKQILQRREQQQPKK